MGTSGSSSTWSPAPSRARLETGITQCSAVAADQSAGVGRSRENRTLCQTVGLRCLWPDMTPTTGVEFQAVEEHGFKVNGCIERQARAVSDPLQTVGVVKIRRSTLEFSTMAR